MESFRAGRIRRHEHKNSGGGGVVVDGVCGRAGVSGAGGGPGRPPAHVYEMRTYTAADGKLANVNARFRDHTVRIFNKHNMKSIGYWTPARRADGRHHADLHPRAPEPRRRRRRTGPTFHADPEWQKAKAESEVDGKIVTKAESVFLTPTDYSPIK